LPRKRGTVELSLRNIIHLKTLIFMKTFITTILMVAVIGTSLAQSIFIKAIGSYNIGVNSDYYYLWATQTIPSGDSLLVFSAHEAVKYSLGGGKTFGGSIGINLLKNLDFDLAFLFSKSTVQDFHIKSDYKLGYGFNVQINYNTSFEAQSTIISPTILYKKPVGNNFLYSRFGLLFADISMKKSQNKDLYNNIPGYYPSEQTEIIEEFESASSLGFTAGVGFEYCLSDHFYLMADVSYNYLKYVPNSSKYTKYEFMGLDELEAKPVSEKEFEYVDKYDDTENQDPDLPAKEVKVSYPFDNVSIQLGLKCIIADFSKKNK